MHLFIAALATETNTFSPIPTAKSLFEANMVTKTASQEPANLFSEPLHVWRREAERLDWKVTESLSAFAQPGGLTVKSVYEEYRDEILNDLRSAGRVDLVLISAHGAMIADGYDDCEGDLLAKIREIVGPDAIVGMTLDPHSHLTKLMLDSADLLICFKEYPHTDASARAKEMFSLAQQACEGKIHPVMRDFDCRMISGYPTPVQPMRGFVDEMIAAEGKGGLLSLSLVHGFPAGDHPRVGTRMLAIVDNDAELAEKVAHEWGMKFWALREQVSLQFMSMEQGFDVLEKSQEFPIVMADIADNAGAGAPSDSTFFLQEVLNRGLTDIVLGLIYDPQVVQICQDAGEGANLSIRIGGKTGVSSGDPVDLNVKVRKLGYDINMPFGQGSMPAGDTVWLDAGGVHIVACTIRQQTFDPFAFTSLGIELDKMKAVIVKSINHFYSAFAPIASQVIYVTSPGAVITDMARIPFTKRAGNYWPKVENPFV